MSNNKQSSVEWLVEQMLNQGYFDCNKPLTYTNLEHLRDQAKAMHKEEMEFCFQGGMALVEGRLWKPTDLFDEFYDKKFNNDGTK